MEPADPLATTAPMLPEPTLAERITTFVPAPPPPENAAPPPPSAAAGSPDEPPPSLPALPPPPAKMTPLDALRGQLQPIAHDLLCDRAYWESLKRTASPRTFLEFVRFAFAADLEAKGIGNNQQVIIQAPFPQGPLDVLPPHLRIS